MIDKKRSRSRLPKRRAARKNPAHIAFIRSLRCCVPGCLSCDEVDPHHIRTSANSGTGLKPADLGNVVPLCHTHHLEYHQIGRKSFEAKHNIDLASIAKKLAVSPPPELL